MLTLGNQRSLTNDMLIKGIIDSVVSVNQFYAMLPFKGIQGNALAYNRELAGADQMDLVSVLNTGHTSIEKNAQMFTRESVELTTIVGDAQVNGLIQAVGSDYNDATAVQVAAKAKGLGRKYMDLMINGNYKPTFAAATLWSDIDAFVKSTFNTADYALVDTEAKRQAITSLTVFGVTLESALTELSGALENLTTAGVTFLTAVVDASLVLNGYAGFSGLQNLVAANQTIATHSIGATDGVKDVLNYLDTVIDRVHDKDGMVDYIMCNSAVVRAITASFRVNGTGFDMMDVKNSSGAVMSIQSYRGVPIFRNDFINSDDLSGVRGGDTGLVGTSAIGDIFVGTLDDGSMSHGICGLTALKSAGMQVQKLGAREEVDADITRVKWYCGLAHFSQLGLVKGVIVA